MPRRFFLPLAALLLMATPSLYASDSMRCGSRLVSVQDHAAEVLAACGEPSFRDRRSVGYRGNLADSELWTYNFGPRQLIYVLSIRNGRLRNIETDGYGFSSPGARHCVPADISSGLSKYRLLNRCGEPLTRREAGYVQTLRPSRRYQHGGYAYRGGRLNAVEVYREEWVYNFGSRYLLRIVTLEDGVVAKIERGKRGFNDR